MDYKDCSLETTAYHEAGHTAIAYIFGGKFKKVTIDKKECRKGMRGGCERYPKKPKDLSVYSYHRVCKYLEPEILISLAGYFAHKRYDPQSADPEYSSDDFEYVIDLIRKIVFSRIREIKILYILDENRNSEELFIKMEDLYLKKFCNETEILLESPAVWKLVELIARALLDKNTLSGKEIADLIGTAIRAQCILTSISIDRP